MPAWPWMDEMDDRLKKRLIGAAVLMSLLMIFVPMLIEKGRIDNRIDEHAIPPRPEMYFPPVGLDAPRPPRKAEMPTGEAETTPPKPVVAAKPKPKPVTKAKPRPKPKPTPPNAHPNAWVVQVASFTDKARAQRLVERLRKAGFTTFISTAWVKGARRYRVRVGPELDVDRARRMARAIERKTKLKGRVQRHR